MLEGRDYTAFQGIGAVSYIANGWNFTATTGYGSGGGGAVGSSTGPAVRVHHSRPDCRQEVRQMGSRRDRVRFVGPDGLKEDHFALGGLIGYDFGPFVAQARLGSDVSHTVNGSDVPKETRAWLTIVAPLWKPATA